MKVLGVQVKLYLQGAVGIGKIAGYGNRHLLNDLFVEGILAASAHIAGKAIGGDFHCVHQLETLVGCMLREMVPYILFRDLAGRHLHPVLLVCGDGMARETPPP